MGAPTGNQNAYARAEFRDAVRKIVARDDWKRLNKIAEKLVSLAEQGEGWAIKEFAERIDGKAVQMLANPDGSNLIPTSLEVALVKAVSRTAGESGGSPADGQI